MSTYQHTAYGKKYHLPSCRYLTGKQPLSGQNGLCPCQHCLRLQYQAEVQAITIKDNHTAQNLRALNNRSAQVQSLNNNIPVFSQIHHRIEAKQTHFDSSQFFEVKDGKVLPNAHLQQRINTLSNAKNFTQLKESLVAGNVWRSSYDTIIDATTAEDILACSIICLEQWISKRNLSPDLMNRFYYGMAHIQWKSLSDNIFQRILRPDSNLGGYFATYKKEDRAVFEIGISNTSRYPIWAVIHELLHYISWHPEQGVHSSGFCRDSMITEEDITLPSSEKEWNMLDPLPWDGDLEMDEACTDWLTEDVIVSWTGKDYYPIFLTDNHDVRFWSAYYGIRSGFNVLAQYVGFNNIFDTYSNNQPDVFEQHLQNASGSDAIILQIHDIFQNSLEWNKEDRETLEMEEHKDTIENKIYKLFNNGTQRMEEDDLWQQLRI